MKRELLACIVCATATVGFAPGASSQEAPPLPTDVPIWAVGGDEVDGRRLRPYDRAPFTIGRTDKEGPLDVGETVRAAAIQTMSLLADHRGGRDVWVRSFEMARAGDPTVLASGEIVMDRRTLAPISSTLRQGESTSAIEYDWDGREIRATGADVQPVDRTMLEAAAHETWVGAIDWSAVARARIPAVLAGGGGAWWAVPRVVGREDVELGDGARREAFVIEMDWWSMDPSDATFTPGGGANGTAGTGGKYWVLVDPPEGMPPVVRIQTEVDATMDNVVEHRPEHGMSD
ncbi:MAG: hypothetical protein AAF389_04825 [Gemmatimonadota bacterium]